MNKIIFEPVTKRVNEIEPILPIRKTSGSAGYDFFIPVDIKIKAGESSPLVFLDIKAKMPEDVFLSLHIRSSLGIKKGLQLANVTGIIDSDYYNNPDNEGNIGIKIKNTGTSDVFLKKGESVAQGIFLKYLTTDNDVANESRTGGFGSTGK